MDELQSFRKDLEEIGRSIRTSSFRDSLSSFRSLRDNNDDELELQWAAIERLPTFDRVRSSLFDHVSGNEDENKNHKRVVDVSRLGATEYRLFIEKLIVQIEEDNRRLLVKMKERIDKVGLQLPTVEVRFKNLSIEAECQVVRGKSLPTLWNTLKTTFHALTNLGRSQTTKIKILKDVSGIIKPSRMTLLLGPPGCGKTTLLQALAGKLSQSLKVEGEISYNGYEFGDFNPQKTSAYISQYDLHMSEMTVRETLDFSARCQGVGDRADMMKEVCRREKQAHVVPEPDIDAYMKAISVEGLKRTMQTHYIIKILGLDICADTIVGDAMNRGISGGQKKRLTTGEVMIGPTKILFMDEISNGLDSSTTFQIVTCLQQLTHITDSTILVSLLQSAPETFELFDDIILMAEGLIVYHGPREHIVEFFEYCGFSCPQRKGVADFLQEVVSRKDQAQYWHREDQPYSYISVHNLAAMFKNFHVGQKLDQELSVPFSKTEFHKNALSFQIYSVKIWELFKACLAREWLLMKRNSFVHVFKSAQLVVVALITMTVFIRTRMRIDVISGNYFMGAIYYALIRLMCNGIAELSLTVSRLAVFYKQRDFYFYPAWTYSIPAAILKIPFSMLDAFLWTAITYYVIGFSPEIERFLCQFLVLFLLHQASVSMFRLIASVVRNPPIAATSGVFCLMVMFLFGGFIIPKPSLPSWLQWAFWLSPLAYAEIAASVNEFHAPRWQKVSSTNATTIGDEVLEQRGLNFNSYFYWISIGALIVFWFIFNLGFTFALTYLKSPGRSKAIISEEKFSRLQGQDSPLESAPQTTKSIGVILPFEPLAISFENVQYFVDTPQKLREQGFPEKRLQLLRDVTGSFRPGILTALMGVSGAGKTTLMDVLSGRKTGGLIEGAIKVGGYPKVQETYARISGYCEQTDIHSPQITVEESVMYSARLRLSAQVDRKTIAEFVAEVLQLIELDEIKDFLVGTPGVSGITIEQRKRLTIAVELVSNPSIIFMDEPTSGLDARAAAIVMRVVKNIVRTNRTVVCTIHQPSIDIFEAFDELILLKRGGEMVYSGALGQYSCTLIEYFENIPGVPKIKENYNPATWMLEITSPSVEAQIGVDFAVLHKESHLYQRNKELVKELSLPPPGSKDLHFPTRYSQNGWQQFKACLWKQHLSYWRSPRYNLLRLAFVAVSSLLFGVLLWKKGQKLEGEQDFFNMLGSVFIFNILTGIANCSSVLPFVANERTVVYRERFAGMYSSWAYSFAQVTVELPYTFTQAAIFLIITYPAVDFYCSAYKIFWYFYSMFCTLLYYNYFGMLLVSWTPSYQVAAIFASLCYTMFSLFAGFVIPGPEIPKWWIWCYWISPSAWSIKGILTSQYGDITEQITVFGQRQAINSFLESYFGYHYDQLGIVAIVLLAFPLVFALAFGYSITKLNFQRR